MSVSDDARFLLLSHRAGVWLHDLELDRRILQSQEAATWLPPLRWQQRAGLLLVVMVLLVSINVSHQLTPVIMFLALAALITRSLVRPVRDLVASTQAVRQGNLQIQVNVSSSDEIATLALNDICMKYNALKYEDEFDIPSDGLLTYPDSLVSIHEIKVSSTPTVESSFQKVEEKFRDEWARAETLEKRKEVARRMQKNAWDFVPHVYMGHFFRVTAFRKSVKGVIGVPEVVPFWNIEKVA